MRSTVRRNHRIGDPERHASVPSLDADRLPVTVRGKPPELMAGDVYRHRMQ
jgi:hypothetical protein